MAWLGPPLLIAQGINRVAHLFVGSAAADVAAQAAFDFGRRRFRIGLKHGFHGDDESRRAEATLLGVEAGKSFRNSIELSAGNEAFGRADRLIAGFERHHAARVHRLAIEEHRAGAASAAIADTL